MDKEELRTGDIVRLASGGPNMTVIERQGSTARCMYANKGDDVMTISVPIIGLVKIEKVMVS